MDILVISHFTNLPGEGGNCRFSYLIEMLNKTNNVEQVTSSFCHASKKQRETNSKGNITFIYEPGYKKNVSLRRLHSHYVMGCNLKKYLDKRNKPDVIYCAIPSLSVAQTAAQYARKNNVKFIIDVQDIWPEAFRMAFHIRFVDKIVFLPMVHMANNVYRQADEIVAVSDTYLKRALQVNRKCKDGLSVFLGTFKEEFDKFSNLKKLSDEDGVFRLAYIGTLGHSYDLTIVFDAMVILKEHGIHNIQFIVMGKGPLEKKFQTYAEKKKIPVVFTGRLDYPEMVMLLTECDIAINPIQHGAAQSITNKVGDYAMAGLPVISTQESQEYRNIIESYHCGFNCDNRDANDIAKKIKYLINHAEERSIMGKNSRRVGEELFDRKKTYPAIANKVLKRN